MPNSYQRILLAEGAEFSEILDSKFKTNELRICLIQPLSAENAAACALAGDIITSCSKAYPTNEAMNRKLHTLYGADLSCNVFRQGDLQVLMLRASAIADRYALEQETIFSDLTEMLLHCILEPNIVNGGFEENEFRICQKNLLDSIDAEINEKRQYAILQANKTAYSGEPAAFSCYGTHAEAAALTPVSAYQAFQKLLQTAQMQFFFVGAQPVEQLTQKLQTALNAIPDRKPLPIVFDSPSPLKAEPALVQEALPVNQCKMVLNWKIGEPNRYAVQIASLILGGTTTSKLFANVREKMSLCYYCAANFAEAKHALMVDCGIEEDNIDKAKTAILAELEDVQNGVFTEEEMESAKMAIHNTMQGIGDTPGSYINWYLTQAFRKTELTPKEEEERLAAVTREQIIAAAKTMKLDTIYIMTCAEQEGNANGNH